MKGAEVKAVQTALSEAIGHRITDHELGLILGLTPANANVSVRKWKDSQPTGPVATALRLLHRLVVELDDEDTINGVREAFGQ